MYRIDLTDYITADSTNNGDNREWALCHYFGIERVKHDKTRYDKGSDVETGDLAISVKAAGFTLMHGNLCKGCNTFEGIWRRYYKRTHSNTWAYITKDWQCYIMDKKEFSKLIHTFCVINRESTKNGGHIKIKHRSETREMLEWLEKNCA